MTAYLPGWMLFWPYGWEFGCDHPECASQAEYDERWYPNAEKRLRADGWASYGHDIHACPAHVAEYIGEAA